MTKKIRCVLSLTIFLVLIAPALCSGNADRIYSENSPAVVVVVPLNGQGQPAGQGSGFIVRDDGAVVTNYHVIALAADIRVKINGVLKEIEGVLHADPENDLAILKIGGTGYQKVRVGDADRARVGEKVYVIGSPQGLENTISEGILSGIREIDGGRRVLQMTAAISPGSSGGPVFNERGEVIGVATFLIAETQSLNFAMPVNLVLPGLSKETLVRPRDACKVNYTQTASCWFFQGLALGSLGQHDRAAESFQRSLTIDPRRAETYVNLGVSLANLGKAQEAADMFREALKIDPDRVEALSNLGALYGQAGRYDEALTILAKAVALKPGDPQIHYNLAAAHLSLGHRKEAIEALKEAVRLAPGFAEAHGLLGLTYAGAGMYPESVSAFKAAIRLNPDDPLLHFGLGKTYLSMGDRVSALDEYKILARLNRSLADALFDLIYK